MACPRSIPFLEEKDQNRVPRLELCSGEANRSSSLGPTRLKLACREEGTAEFQVRSPVALSGDS